jgi:hypothetical protein
MTTHYQLLVPLKLARIYVAWEWHNRIPPSLQRDFPELYDSEADAEAQIDLTSLLDWLWGRNRLRKADAVLAAKRLAAVQRAQGLATPKLDYYDWTGIVLNRARTLKDKKAGIWEPVPLGD